MHPIADLFVCVSPPKHWSSKTPLNGMISIALIFLTVCFLLGLQLTITGLHCASEGYQDIEGFHAIILQKEPLELSINPQWLARLEEMLTPHHSEPSSIFGQLPSSPRTPFTDRGQCTDSRKPALFSQPGFSQLDSSISEEKAPSQDAL